MLTDRAVPIWPFPGQDTSPWWECYPPHNMPPPRFSAGDRVQTRWGCATVLRVYDYERHTGRAYQLRYDWSSSPPESGFGHLWSEDEMEPLTQAAEPEEDDQPAPAAAPRVAQLELFA